MFSGGDGIGISEKANNSGANNFLHFAHLDASMHSVGTRTYLKILYIFTSGFLIFNLSQVASQPVLFYLIDYLQFPKSAGDKFRCFRRIESVTLRKNCFCASNLIVLMAEPTTTQEVSG